jgi:hypothetical protein
MILGIHLLMLVGPGVPVPAPLPLTDALSGIQVTHNDSGRSGFQLTFQVGRRGMADLVDYDLLLHPLLQPMSRVILTVIFNGTPRVLSDGFITDRALSPGNEPGASTLTVNGEDVSVMMDLMQITISHPAQNETAIAFLILNRYQAYLLSTPLVLPAPSVPPSPTQTIPQQHSSDREMLEAMAGRHDFRFFIMPGLFPGQNFAYWGPKPVLSLPQRALSVNLGPFSNVETLTFQQHGLAPTAIVDIVPGPQNVPTPVAAPLPTMAPTALLPLPPLRLSLMHGNLSNADVNREDMQRGVDYMTLMAHARSEVNRSYNRAVTASGSLDALQYGDMLMARGLVQVRGAGLSHNGDYYVKSVTHNISKGSYKQSFSLEREGLGPRSPMVRPQ